jgi:hypothetical protein
MSNVETALQTRKPVPYLDWNSLDNPEIVTMGLHL